MKINNEGYITEATESELWKYYLTREFDDVISFDDFLGTMKLNGVQIVEEVAQTVFDKITQSEEKLAETYMFNHDGKEFKSLLLPHKVFNSREEAHAATVAKLKEVAE